jgi:hypothetical protein
MSGRHSIFELLIVAGVASAGCFLLAFGGARLEFRNPELSWYKVMGKVMVSGVDEGATSGGRRTYRAMLEYVYEFHGIRFIGERVAPLQFTPNYRASAESITRRYPPGSAVTVYVNPRNPGRAVLEPGPQVIAALCHALIGVAFCLMALVIMFSR